MKWNSQFPVSVSAVHRTGGEIHVQVEILIVHTYIDTTIDNGGPSCTVTDWPFIISVNFTITIDIFIDQIPGKDGCITFPVNIYRIIINLLLRSEEHTSELQSRGHLVCRLLLEKQNFNKV